MGSFVFNGAKGKVAYYAGLPATNDALVVVLLQAAEADDTLNNYTDLATLIAAAGNTEATFTNYTRLDPANVVVTVDNTANTVKVTFDPLTYTNAGGAINNSVVKLLVCYDNDTTGGTDSNIIPLTAHDAPFTTDGTTQTINCPAGGFFAA
jgi:ABC-type transport system substrate-binding protein